jgi:hypothetical protein
MGFNAIIFFTDVTGSDGCTTSTPICVAGGVMPVEAQSPTAATAGIKQVLWLPCLRVNIDHRRSSAEMPPADCGPDSQLPTRDTKCGRRQLRRVDQAQHDKG